MQKFDITKQEYNFINEVYSHGIAGGVTLQTVKEATKCLRKIDQRFRDIGDAIKLKGKEVRAKADKEEDEEKRGKILADFDEEVDKAIKDPETILCTKDYIKALVDILERVDWTRKELLNKFKAADTIMLEVIIENLKAAKDENEEEEKEPKKKK